MPRCRGFLVRLNRLNLWFASSEPVDSGLVKEEEQMVFIGSSSGGASPTTKVRPLTGALLVVLATVATSLAAMIEPTFTGSSLARVRSGILKRFPDMSTQYKTFS